MKGRAPIDPVLPQKIRSVMLDDATAEIARIIGNNNISEGVRRAIRYYPLSMADEIRQRIYQEAREHAAENSSD